MLFIWPFNLCFVDLFSDQVELYAPINYEAVQIDDYILDGKEHVRSHYLVQTPEELENDPEEFLYDHADCHNYNNNASTIQFVIVNAKKACYFSTGCLVKILSLFLFKLLLVHQVLGLKPLDVDFDPLSPDLEDCHHQSVKDKHQVQKN